MKMFRLLIVSVFAISFLGCGAGTGYFVGEPQRISITPGGSDSVTFSLEVEGAYAGVWNFTTTSEITGVTSSVTPTSADVQEGTPQTVTVAIDASGAAAGASGLVLVRAAQDDGDHTAGSSVYITIE